MRSTQGKVTKVLNSTVFTRSSQIPPDTQNVVLKVNVLRAATINIVMLSNCEEIHSSQLMLRKSFTQPDLCSQQKPSLGDSGHPSCAAQLWGVVEI
jgi:hypothetical protein